MPLLIETEILMTGHFAKGSLSSCGMTPLGDARSILQSDK